MADINLTPGDDLYVQPVENRNLWDNVFGLVGNDRFKMYQGVAVGGIGNDVIERLDYPGESWHQLQVGYWESPTGVVVNLAEGWADDGWGTRDTLVGVSGAHASGRDDRFIGDAADNYFWGNGGSDNMVGGAGTDGIGLPWFKPAAETNNRQALLSDLDIQVSVDGQSAVVRPKAGTGFSYTLSGIEYFDAQTEDGGTSQRYYLADFITQASMSQQAIAAGDAFRWNTGSPLGSTATVSFSFVNNAPASGVGAAGFRAFTAAEQQAVRDILNKTAALAGINFTEVSDSGPAVGQMRFGVSQQAATKGVSWMPGQAGAGDLAGDVWMDVESMIDLAPGSEGYAALLHEIGHALGLRHPRNVDPGDNWSAQLRVQDDISALTVMSQTASADGLFRADWGPLDVGALRYLYGSRAAATGDNTYTLGNRTIAQTSIVDDGGTDTLDASASASPVSIDLRPGSPSSAGLTPAGIAGVNNISIYTTSLVENALGSRFDDVVTGNDTDNRLTAGLGNDLIDGGKGTDTAAFAGKFTDYTVTTAFGKVYVEARDGSSGYDTLLDIETLAFADRTVSVAVAVLGKTANADFDGDGRSDILWRNVVSGANAVWRGGDAAQNTGVTGLADLNWTIAGTGDFDGDRKSDILWRHAATGDIALWKRGDSAAGASLTRVSDLSWRVVGTGDFDGDGKSDSLWRNASTGEVASAKGGDFGQRVNLTTVNDPTWLVAGTGDFDADGKSDILWRNTATGAGLVWLRGDSAAPTALATVGDQKWGIAGVGDFDGDGKGDILWRHSGSGASVIWRSGDFAQRVAMDPVTDLNWKIVGLGDYTGDGKADILWRDTVTGADALWTDVWGDASSGADNPWKGGNPASRVALTTVADVSWTITNQVNGLLDQPVRAKPATSDFDGDGKSDILWRHAATGSNTIWKSADSALGINVSSVGDLNWKVAGVADFDGDGKSDILWRNTVLGDNTAWRNGDSASPLNVTAVADLNWKIVGLGDFDGDGKADLLWRHGGMGANAIWRSADSASPINVNPVGDIDWKVAGIGDFDGDGKADLLWRHGAMGANAIWRSADSASGINVTSVGDLNWKVVGVADFDGDGKSDILWRNTAMGANTIWKSADSALSINVTPVADLAWKVFGVGDYDGDGKSDILWRHTVTGADTIWKGGDSALPISVTSVGDLNWAPQVQPSSLLETGGQPLQVVEGDDGVNLSAALAGDGMSDFAMPDADTLELAWALDRMHGAATGSGLQTYAPDWADGLVLDQGYVDLGGRDEGTGIQLAMTDAPVQSLAEHPGDERVWSTQFSTSDPRLQAMQLQVQEGFN